MSLKKLEASQSQKAIIDALLEGPLTFKELLEKSGISRAVLNKHLKTLEKQGVIEKIYKDGKILNVLKPENFSLREWLLNQLAPYGIPQESIEKGRKLLTDKMVFLIVSTAPCIVGVGGDLLKRYPQYSLFGLNEIEPCPVSEFEFRRTFGLKDKTLIQLANQIDVFSLAITILYLGYLATSLEGANINMSVSTKEILDAVIWWTKEISNFIPSSKLIAITVLAFIFETHKEIMKFIQRLKSKELKEDEPLGSVGCILFFITEIYKSEKPKSQSSEVESPSSQNP